MDIVKYLNTKVNMITKLMAVENTLIIVGAGLYRMTGNAIPEDIKMFCLLALTLNFAYIITDIIKSRKVNEQANN